MIVYSDPRKGVRKSGKAPQCGKSSNLKGGQRSLKSLLKPNLADVCLCL